MDASYVDLADPSHLEFDYLRWIRVVLLSVAARRVLHIGGGACVLPRALAARDPGGLQQVCELDGEVLAISREHLGLRRMPGLRVRNVDGRAFLTDQAPGAFDAIVIDAFIGAIVPSALVSNDALLEARRVAPLALVNVVDDRSARVVDAIASTLGAAYPSVWRIGGRGGNTVLIGGSLPEAACERITARLAADASPAHLVGPALR